MILGSMQVLIPVAFYSFVINKLSAMYESLGVSQGSSPFIFLGILFLLGIVNLALGISNFRLKGNISQKRFMTSVVVAGISFFMMGICSAVILYCVYAPLYLMMN